ncbi:MAG: LysR substrate-binding domain-containing protein [Pseudomonadota bacterium]
MSESHQRPALRSLEVFEAAARLSGFTAAGRELGITQSAVSRQISDLEAVIGVALFNRSGARVSTTPSGVRLAETLRVAFDDIRAAVGEAAGSESVVTLSMLPSVAGKWFAPRLGQFVSDHPGIDLRVTASRHLVDFQGEGVDAAIRYGRGGWPGLFTRKLATETLRPVCTPAYAARIGLAAPADLARASLLHGDLPETWATWFAAAGCAMDPPTGPRLGDDGALLQAALDHQGVALGRSLLIADDVAVGKLITPFETELPASHAYWFVRPEAREPGPALRAVERWVAAQFETGRGENGAAP